MIDIPEKDLIEYLEKYANNEISLAKLTKILNTDYRTMNNKIIKISIDYPELYEKIIKNHPYKQKGRTDIDYEALLIYVLKSGITIEEATKIFNISRRTIQRRIRDIEKENPKLYRLYKISNGRGHKKAEREIIENEIEKLEYRDVVISDINEDREKFLLDIEKKFNDLVAAGNSREEAANIMGYKKSIILKMLNELYRLKIEKNTINQKSKEFRNSLAVDAINNKETKNNNKNNQEVKKGNGVIEDGR